jgi:hypothetical protein
MSSPTAGGGTTSTWKPSQRCGTTSGHRSPTWRRPRPRSTGSGRFVTSQRCFGGGRGSAGAEGLTRRSPRRIGLTTRMTSSNTYEPMSKPGSRPLLAERCSGPKVLAPRVRWRFFVARRSTVPKQDRTPVRSAVSEPLDALRGVILRWPPGAPDSPVRAACFCSEVVSPAKGYR